MRKITIVCLFLVSVALVGCGGAKVSTGGKTTVETDQGKATVTVNEETDSWCAEGSTVKTETPQGTVNAVVKGLATSGKYAGCCHMVTSVDVQGQNIEIDYYYTEEGSGYQVMDIAGQTMETAWHK